jgi:hypothetical protein
VAADDIEAALSMTAPAAVEGGDRDAGTATAPTSCDAAPAALFTAAAALPAMRLLVVPMALPQHTTNSNERMNKTKT